MHAITGRSGARLQIGTAVMRAGSSFRDSVELAQRFEDSGFDFLTTGDNGPETFALAGAIAFATSTIKIASSVAVWTRSPATMAHSAMTVANLSSGRFGLGIGPGPKQWVNDWHGMAFDPVMPRMREYLAALRACLQASEAHPTEVDGHYFPTHGYGGWDIVVPEPVSLHLGASQQKMTELAGELCDGVMLNNLHPLDWVAEHAEAHLKTGRARAGRPDDFDFTVEIGRFVGIHPDRATAYDLCRQQLCFYFAIPYFRTVLEPYGFGPELDAGELALRSGNRPDLVAAVSDRMVDAIAIAGTTDEVYAKLEAYSPYVDAINISGGMNIESSEAVAHLERMITVFGRS